MKNYHTGKKYLCSKSGHSIRRVLFFKVTWDKVMTLVSSFNADIKHFGKKNEAEDCKINITVVWGREKWDMINENRREIIRAERV